MGENHTVQNPLVLLVTGFLLSGVAGGFLGYFFQQRAWAHQHAVQRADLQREQAQQTFEDLSTLMDRRLYRMRLVHSAARRQALSGGHAERLDHAVQDYRLILRDWNDTLNRNLALIDTYFGPACRGRYEDELLANFVATGEELDQLYAKSQSVRGLAFGCVGSHHA